MLIKMGEVIGINNGRICPRCKRVIPEGFIDCPFCDVRYRVVRGQ